jgi:hypothetical protein
MNLKLGVLVAIIRVEIALEKVRDPLLSVVHLYMAMRATSLVRLENNRIASLWIVKE